MSTLAATSVVPLYAGFWRRASAVILDGLVVAIPNVLIHLSLPDRPLRLLASVILGCAYYAGFHSSSLQATPGKGVFGIKVTDTEGRRISLGRAIGRYFASWLSFLVLGIGFLMAAFTQRRQALHDMICGTLVVNKSAPPAEILAGGGVMPVTAGVWAVAIFLVVLPFTGGILAGILVPAYRDYLQRAKVAEVIAASRPLQQDIERAASEKRAWTVGTVPINSKNASAAEITQQGNVVVNLSEEISRGGRLKFTPSNSPGGVQWKCSGESIQPKLLPASCRE
jgi:uncharacterized RDD family membrane protein YckC/Tfp pilus assembly protein PilE